MHYSQQGYEGMGMGEQQPTSPQSPEEAGVQDGVRGHASINTILDQIMTITDQSLDEVHTTYYYIIIVLLVILIIQIQNTINSYSLIKISGNLLHISKSLS